MSFANLSQNNRIINNSQEIATQLNQLQNNNAWIKKQIYNFVTLDEPQRKDTREKFQLSM